MRAIGIYHGHDSSWAVYDNGKYHVLEMERYYGVRHYCWNHFYPEFDGYREPLDILKCVWGIPNDFDTCAYTHFIEPQLVSLKQSINAKQYIDVKHQAAHATCAFYQSPFQKSLVVTSDGWGNDGVFKIFIMERGKDPEVIAEYNQTLGEPYGWCGVCMKEIRTDKPHVMAGKIMGLAPYGQPRKAWMRSVRWYYRQFHKKVRARPKILRNLATQLAKGLKISYNVPDSIEGKDSEDLAATFQAVFEAGSMGRMSRFIEQHDLPICMSGGCALNVTFNEVLRRKYPSREIYVPPNPNDSGIALGALLDVLRPQERVHVHYAGLPMLDSVGTVTERRLGCGKVTLAKIVQMLRQGDIIGVIRGNSECGPRALGNRSILCDPSFPKMKDVLNKRVKFREYFRPFAPVVIEEKVSFFFEMDRISPYMSFAPLVRREWRDKIPAVVHVDGTSRVQTVNRAQNPWLYDLLAEFEKFSGYPILLNTSFNTKGKPILTRASDALEMLEMTGLDAVIIEDRLYRKPLQRSS